MWSYWKSTLALAFRNYVAILANARRHMILFIMQTALLFGLLYFLPWFGNVQDEARLVAATVAAVLASGLLLLVWEILKAPMVRQTELAMRLEEAEIALGLDADVDSIRERALSLCSEGRALQQLGDDLTMAAVEDWKARSLDFVRENYYPQFAYQMENELHLGNKFQSAKPQQRLNTLLGTMESAALSFGSKQEAKQQLFSPRRYGEIEPR